jgi:hypothetical protein
MAEAAASGETGEALRRELQPGEQVAAGIVMTSPPSRWAVAAFLVPAVALVAVSLAGLFGQHPGPLTAGPAAGLVPVLLVLGIESLSRRMFVAVTSQRLICLRLSRLRRAPRQLVLAVPLAEVRIVQCRPGRFASSLQFEAPGHDRIRLAVSRAGRRDFATVAEALARSGAFAALDPPWPSAAIS